MKSPRTRTNIDAIAELRTTPSFLLSQSARLMRESMIDALRPTGLSLQEMTILKLLATGGGVSQQTLGAACNLDKTTITELIDSLESAGYARRDVSETDRRSKVISITPSGKKVLGKAVKSVDAVEQEFLSLFSEREWSTVRKCLARFLDTNG